VDQSVGGRVLEHEPSRPGLHRIPQHVVIVERGQHEHRGTVGRADPLLLAVTFFAFGTSGVSFIKMFGIGLAIAVLMDAFVIRGFLVPAFMKLAGNANWWAPRPLRRLHGRIGLREA
jgi:uncharacterized membrane protein YdfJ with MMPL/SSD domain